MAPADEHEDAFDAETAGAFTVLKQKLDFDVSFFPRQVKGKATLEIQPQDERLRYIQLNCRQLNITSVTVQGRQATSYYSNLYQRLSLYPGTNVQQHHFIKSRMHRHATGGELELEILVPETVKIERMKPEDATADQVAANAFGADGENLYTPLKVEIDYILENPRDALQFIGVEDGDARYPHVYTRNSPFPGTASCLFPCVDDGITKCIYEITVRYPRTLGDVYSKPRPVTGTNGTAQLHDSPESKADSVMSDVDDDPAEFTEEEKALEMAVICSGELTDDVSMPWKSPQTATDKE
jgi:transcription initiation factor TFIID subunit 2